MGLHNGRRQSDRRRKRDAEAAATAEIDKRYEHPPESECDLVRNPVEMPNPEFLMSQKLWFYHGRLVAYAIALSRRTSAGDWREVYSVDTRNHGTFHDHPTGHSKPNDRRDIAPLLSQVDVQESFDEGHKLVLDRYYQLNEDN